MSVPQLSLPDDVPQAVLERPSARTVGRRLPRSNDVDRRRRTPLVSRRSVLVVVALAVVYVVWGSTYLAMSVVVTAVPPMLAMAVRFAIAGLLLLVVARVRRPAASVRLRWREVAEAALTGVLLLVGGTGLVALAQTRISSGLAALLASTVPLFLALSARVSLGEQLSRRAGAGLVVGLTGVAVLVDPGGGQLLAVLTALLGSALWAAGSIRSRRQRGPADPVLAAGTEMVGAAIAFALLGLVRGEFADVEVVGVAPSVWVALAYLTVAGSLVGYTAYSWLLRNVRTAVVGTYAYVNPVVAVALGWLVLGERITLRTLLAGLLVLGSVVLLVTGRPGVPVPAQVTSGADVFAGPRRRRVGTILLQRVGVSRPGQERRSRHDATRSAARAPRAARWPGARRQGSAVRPAGRRRPPRE